MDHPVGADDVGDDHGGVIDLHAAVDLHQHLLPGQQRIHELPIQPHHVLGQHLAVHHVIEQHVGELGQAEPGDGARRQRGEGGISGGEHREGPGALEGGVQTGGGQGPHQGGEAPVGHGRVHDIGRESVEGSHEERRTLDSGHGGGRIQRAMGPFQYLLLHGESDLLQKLRADVTGVHVAGEDGGSLGI